MNPVYKNHSQGKEPTEKIKTWKIVYPAFQIESYEKELFGIVLVTLLDRPWVIASGPYSRSRYRNEPRWIRPKFSSGQSFSKEKNHLPHSFLFSNLMNFIFLFALDEFINSIFSELIFIQTVSHPFFWNQKLRFPRLRSQPTHRKTQKLISLYNKWLQWYWWQRYVGDFQMFVLKLSPTYFVTNMDAA